MHRGHTDKIHSALLAYQGTVSLFSSQKMPDGDKNKLTETPQRKNEYSFFEGP